MYTVLVSGVCGYWVMRHSTADLHEPITYARQATETALRVIVLDNEGEKVHERRGDCGEKPLEESYTYIPSYTYRVARSGESTHLELRYRIAIAAMGALLDKFVGNETIARDAYALADAMLEARRR